jgi:hypothetical protein
MAPTSRCSYNGGSSGQWLVLATSLFLLVVFATALGNYIYVRLAGLPCLWSRLQMLVMPFCSPGALIHQVEEHKDVLHIVCG